MRLASETRIRLNRVQGVSDADWALLSQLWFWLVTSGRGRTHTFGYIRSELPPQFQGPLASWIAQAREPDGEGSEPRLTLDGEVVRVNVMANSITIEGGGVIV